jgi:hypothetical protein
MRLYRLALLVKTSPFFAGQFPTMQFIPQRSSTALSIDPQVCLRQSAIGEAKSLSYFFVCEAANPKIELG